MNRRAFAQQLAFLAATLSPGFAAETARTPAKLPENLDLFLLIGQSNMAGRGTVTPADQVPDPRVWMLNRAGTWSPAVDPMHFDKSVAGVGLGRTFGLRVADAQSGKNIGLIPCAVGGSPIDSWKPGVFYEPTQSHPWDDAVRRTRIARKNGILKGILWHQGESDATPELAPGYEAKLHDLIARLRQEFDTADVPFLAGQMGQFSDRPWNDATRRVDQVHRELPNKVRRTAWVSATGLQHNGDQIHFDAASYRELGRRFADAYRGMVGI